MEILKQLDELKKFIKDPDGKKKLSDLRKRIKRSESYSNKLEEYFTRTLDGEVLSDVAKELGIL